MWDDDDGDDDYTNLWGRLLEWYIWHWHSTSKSRFYLQGPPVYIVCKVNNARALSYVVSLQECSQSKPENDVEERAMSKVSFVFAFPELIGFSNLKKIDKLHINRHRENTVQTFETVFLIYLFKIRFK